MSDIPHQILSDHFQDRMGGRRLIGAVFTAFQLDPGFFEREILPVFLDVNLSHAHAIKLVQLEDCLRSLPGGIAVYYDANGLVLTDDGAAKLDVRRIPLRVSTGIFHPKNVLALVEEVEPDEDGQRRRTLLVAALSANLTRSGWWQNVEACHVEELGDGEVTCMREDLLAFFKTLRARSPAGCDHTALEQIASFVRRTEQRPQRKVDGQIQAHFFAGDRPFDDFLADVLGTDPRELYLEVISPYFDAADRSVPLEQLIKRFRPRSVRVYLPRNASGEAEVEPAMYEWLARHDIAEWGKLPAAMTRSGKGEEARPRCVHAKVYRFFSMQKKEEYLAIGSVNLTRPAHQQGGNVESAIVLEIRPSRRPDFLDGAGPQQARRVRQPHVRRRGPRRGEHRIEAVAAVPLGHGSRGGVLGRHQSIAAPRAPGQRRAAVRGDGARAARVGTSRCPGLRCATRNADLDVVRHRRRGSRRAGDDPGARGGGCGRSHHS